MGNEIVRKPLAKRPAIRGTLSPAQRQAVALFACGATVAVVAAETGVSVPTIRRWKQDDRFAHEVDVACREVQTALVRQLAARLPGVITSLADDAVDPALRPTERAAAAKILLDRLPLNPIAAFETAAARHVARAEAPKEVTEVELVEIMRLQLEVARINAENADKRRKTVLGELVRDDFGTDDSDDLKDAS